MAVGEEELREVLTEPSSEQPEEPKRSVSIFRKRWHKFRTLKRGYYSFLIVVAAYLISFILPILINNKPLALKFNGEYHFPIRTYVDASEFDPDSFGEPDYRALRERFASEGEGNWVLMPPFPYSPNENLLDMEGVPPHSPSAEHPFGTDNRARDILARLAYGFNISLSFALLVLVFSYVAGIVVGASIGYFGGKLDILGQRAIEIWSSLPFLYMIIIVSSIIVPTYIQGRNQLLQPSFWLLIIILSAFGWMGITYYVRGEFYREKAKDYIGAAIAMGASERAIMFRHILPNALTPVVSFAPFAIVGNISALVALDFLGFGLPAPHQAGGS